ncbi:hypothetical protein A2U01_0065181, partial [Trifolium medium]|nr:hypothetical protein [Trifolium medium]
ILQNFSAAPHMHMPPDPILVLRKTPSVLWIKANTDGSVSGDTAAAA